MNLAVCGIDSDIRWNNEGSFHKDELRDERFDFILANPPFNVSDWGGDKLREDGRWNIHPTGRERQLRVASAYHPSSGPQWYGGRGACQRPDVVLAVGRGDIRKAMVEGDIVDCMIALPGQLFYSTQIPACLCEINESNIVKVSGIIF